MTPEIEELRAALEGEGYIAEPAIATALFLCSRCASRCWSRATPGVGKTELAKVLARLLGTELIRLQCYEGLDVQTALYEWDYPRQLLRLRIAEGRGEDRAGRRAPDLQPRLPARAAAAARHHPPGRPAVLLIDEIDRADDGFEAFLLELLSDFQVTIPELGTIRAEHPPFVVLTSNRTRELGDALRRRCLYLYIEHPSLEKEVRIIRTRCPEARARLAPEVGRFLPALRARRLVKSPGVAETLDWTQALLTLQPALAGARGGGADPRLPAQGRPRPRDASPPRSWPPWWRRPSRRDRGEEPPSAHASDDPTRGCGWPRLGRALRGAGRRHHPARRAGRGGGARARRPRRPRGGAAAPCGSPSRSRAADFETFDRLFAVFWDGRARAASRRPAAPTRRDRPARPAAALGPRRPAAGGAERRAAPAGDQPGYSPEALLRRKPFDEVAGRTATSRRWSASSPQLARRLARAAAGAWSPRGGRGRADVRASYRRALADLGRAADAWRAGPAPVDEPRLVFLCDTSGSMDAHTRFLLTFALSRAAGRPAGRGVRLQHRARPPDAARSRPASSRLTLDRLAGGGAGLVGRHPHRRLPGRLRRRAPGARASTATPWSSSSATASTAATRPGSPAAVRRRSGGRARALIWLNPLLGDPRYEPAAAGMQAALPFVDHFAAAHDLESLERLAPPPGGA